MTPDEALTQLSITAEASSAQRLEAHARLKGELETKLGRAPTEGLKAKYRDAITRIDQAIEVLEIAGMGTDLPALAPSSPLAAPAAVTSPLGELARVVSTRPRNIQPPSKLPMYLAIAAAVVISVTGVGWFVHHQSSRRASAISLTARISALQHDASDNEIRSVAASVADFPSGFSDDHQAAVLGLWATKEKALGPRAVQIALKEKSRAESAAKRSLMTHDERLSNANSRLNALDQTKSAFEEAVRKADRQVGDLKSSERDLAKAGGWQAAVMQQERLGRERLADWLNKEKVSNQAWVNLRNAADFLREKKPEETEQQLATAEVALAKLDEQQVQEEAALVLDPLWRLALKFWLNGEQQPVTEYLAKYTISQDSLQALLGKLSVLSQPGDEIVDVHSELDLLARVIGSQDPRVVSAKNENDRRRQLAAEKVKTKELEKLRQSARDYIKNIDNNSPSAPEDIVALCEIAEKFGEEDPLSVATVKTVDRFTMKIVKNWVERTPNVPIATLGQIRTCLEYFSEADSQRTDSEIDLIETAEKAMEQIDTLSAALESWSAHGAIPKNAAENLASFKSLVSGKDPLVINAQKRLNAYATATYNTFLWIAHPRAAAVGERIAQATKDIRPFVADNSHWLTYLDFLQEKRKAIDELVKLTDGEVATVKMQYDLNFRQHSSVVFFSGGNIYIKSNLTLSAHLKDDLEFLEIDQNQFVHKTVVSAPLDRLSRVYYNSGCRFSLGFLPNSATVEEEGAVGRLRNKEGLGIFNGLYVETYPNLDQITFAPTRLINSESETIVNARFADKIATFCRQLNTRLEACSSMSLRQAHAAYETGMELQQRSGGVSAPAYSIELLEQAGVHGCVPAMVTLAQWLSTSGKVEDDKGAYSWYLAAAKSGDAASMWQVGQFLRSGRGVTVDRETGDAWIGKATAAGYVPER